MKFYVVKSNSPKVNIRSKKCYSADNLTTAYAKFSISVINKEANYIFLIADFEDRKSTFFHRIKMEDNNNSMLPYFILALYDSSIDTNDPSVSVLHNSTRIISPDGFILEFCDNFSAMKSYLKTLDEANYDIEFCINYCLCDDKSETVYTRTIDNSTQMYLLDSWFCTKRFKFNLDDFYKWKPVQTAV